MAVRIVPLGGLGEIGMNCMAIELGSDDSSPIVIVDCGVMFSHENLGIDVIHPDFSYLETHRDRIAALLVTHGHEDHIGAIPYLLRRIDLPIYAPPYARGLIQERLQQDPILHSKPSPQLFTTQPRTPFTLSVCSHKIEVEPIQVTHSIVDSTALFLQSDHARVLHTGDFKIDEAIHENEIFDAERFAALGRHGIDLLLSDSTNSDAPGKSRTEQSVHGALERAILAAPYRVVVALFASNIRRVRSLLAVAQKTSRQVLLLGRSMNEHARIAQVANYLNVPPNLLVSVEDAARVPREKLLVLATGSQAEPKAALARLAYDEYPNFHLEPGDSVMLSSRIIPGNEPSVMHLIGDFYRRGCLVHFSATDPEIHTTGHAYRDEQRAMLDLIQPKAFIPIHGTRHHLEQHAALAREIGVKHVLVIENGEIANFDTVGTESLSKLGDTAVGKVFVDSSGEIDDNIIHDRRVLGELGVATAVVYINAYGRPVAQPSIMTYGLFDEKVHWELLANAQTTLFETLRTYPWPSEQPTNQDIRELSALTLRRVLARFLRRKPVALIMIARHERQPTPTQRSGYSPRTRRS